MTNKTKGNITYTLLLITGVLILINIGLQLARLWMTL